MSDPTPVQLDRKKVYRFVIIGKPWVQKNNLHILYRDPRKKTGAFVDHSEDMKNARNAMSTSLYNQFKKQGGRDPIDHFVEVNFVFYVKKAHEPDLDNLPAIVCDAMQGIKVKGTKLRVASILKDDKLIRKESSQKIVKGDVNYVGEPRTEIELRRFDGARV